MAPRSLRGSYDVGLSNRVTLSEAHALKFAELPIGATLAADTVRTPGPALDAVAPEFPYSGWFAPAAGAASHRELVRTFVRIMARATAYTNAHKSRTAALLARSPGRTSRS